MQVDVGQVFGPRLYHGGAIAQPDVCKPRMGTMELHGRPMGWLIQVHAFEHRTPVQEWYHSHTVSCCLHPDHAKHTRRTIICFRSIIAPAPLSARVHSRVLLDDVDNGGNLLVSCAMHSKLPVEGSTAMDRCWNESARRPHVCFLTMHQKTSLRLLWTVRGAWSSSPDHGPNPFLKQKTIF